jgi:hypothetical protein
MYLEFITEDGMERVSQGEGQGRLIKERSTKVVEML